MAESKYILITIDGEVVTVDGDKQTLVAKDVQDQEKNGQRVHIEERNNTSNNTKEMALFFEHEDKDYVYVLVNNAGKLQLEEQGSKGPVTLSGYCWFEKYDIKNGNHYGLRSVVEPNKKYICFQDDNDGELLCLSPTKEKLVHVIHKEIS